MVPYCSNPYAEHALRLVGGDPSTKADPLQMGQIQTLIEAAEKIRDIVKGMESLSEIKGYLLYKENTSKKHMNDADEQMLQSERDAELTRKFDQKDVSDFVPCFLLEQQVSEAHFEYEDFDQCVDEYFSQSLKQREKAKLDS